MMETPSTFFHRTDIVPGIWFKQQNLIKWINGGHKICVTRSKYSLTYTGNDQLVVI